MKRLGAVLALVPGLLTGCTVTDSHPDYGRRGYYEQGQVYDPNAGYVQPVYPQPGYVQPGYVQGGYGQPVYPPPGGGYVEGGDYRRDRDRQENQRPAGPQLPPGVNLEALQAGDELVGAIDRYVQSINKNTQPLVMDMKRILVEMRSATDTWRTSVRNQAPRQTLQVAANDLLNRFNAANERYAQMVASNSRYKSDQFARVASATARVVNSVR